jgi:hypothetical protein
MLSLAFLNQGATADLESHLTNNLKNWINDWCLLQIPPVLSVVSCSKIDLDAYDRINISKKNRRLFFAAEDKGVNWEKLVFSDMNSDVLENIAVKDILKAAIDDLFTSFFGPHEASDSASLRFPKNIKTYIKITISFADIGVLNLTCPHSMWESLAKKVQHKGLHKKIKRNDLIALSVANLSLSLHGGSMFVEDLKNISIGTVIKLQGFTENKFSLTVGSKKIASAALGKIGTKKAFITLIE